MASLESPPLTALSDDDDGGSGLSSGQSSIWSFDVDFESSLAQSPNTPFHKDEKYWDDKTTYFQPNNPRQTSTVDRTRDGFVSTGPESENQSVSQVEADRP